MVYESLYLLLTHVALSGNSELNSVTLSFQCQHPLAPPPQAGVAFPSQQLLLPRPLHHQQASAHIPTPGGATLPLAGLHSANTCLYVVEPGTKNTCC